MYASAESQESGLGIRGEAANRIGVGSDDRFDVARRAVAQADPDNLRGCAMDEAPLMEIRILGHDDEPMLASVLPVEGPDPLRGGTT